LSRVAAGRSIEVVEGDIRDASPSVRWLDEVEVVVNLAGESGALKSFHEAQADAQVNVTGHLRLLDAIRRLRAPPRVVFLSSRLVYGATGRAAAREDHPTAPTSVYGLHKLTVEHYYRLYWQHYGIPYCVLRVTNTYGLYQLPNRRTHGVINQFILAALSGHSLSVYGDGSQLRDYVHVADVATAIILAATHEQAVGGIFNIGAGVSVGLDEVANRIVRLAGKGRVARIVWPDELLKVETGDFRCDISRARERLSWRPEVGLDEGLLTTISGYRALLEC